MFLGIALLFVLFLIWQAWIEEQNAALTAPTAQSLTDDRQGAVPAAPAFAPAADVPVPSAPAQTQEAPPAAAGTRITVVTDQFEAVVSTVGGDLSVVRLRQYPVSIDQPEVAFTLLDDSPDKYFVAQSGLVSADVDVTLPDHYAEFQTPKTEYRLVEGQDSLEVPLSWQQDGVKVAKTYTFYRDSFVVDLKHRVDNGTDNDWSGSQYQQLQRVLPPEKSGNEQFARTYTGGVISSPEKRYEKVSFDDMVEEPLQRDIQDGWVAMIQHYFVAAWVPPQGQVDRYFARQVGASDRYVIGMTGPLATVSAGGSTEYGSRLYVGPKIPDRLEALAPGLELTVDYGWLTVIAQPLFWLLDKIHGLVGNWGWSIIILTMLIKGVFFKLSETSYRSMANMRKLQPRMKTIRERYAGDKQKVNQAMMDLYKKEKINPMGGCLPIVVQIPVFIALYWMLLESVQLRQAPFMLWIHDLSAQDPYYVLPVLMGISMFIQQRLNPAPPDPIQAKVMMALPLVFTVFFLWFPSGLVLYWLTNNILSIAQQWVITKRVEAGED